MTRPMSEHVWRQQDAMLAMIERLGVDIGTLARLEDGRALLHAMDRCLACPCPSECHAWLDGDRFARDPQAYCPNLPVFLDWTRH